MKFISLFILSLSAFVQDAMSQQKKALHNFKVIAYYSSNASNIDSFPIEKLTHIIFSFCHLRGAELAVDKKADTVTIQKLVSLKVRNPKLKVLLSLGGWGGCKSCSDVFSTDEGRKTFAESVKNLTHHFNTDGIDLDWEYPAIEGHPGHAYMEADKDNFTELVKLLRRKLGKNKEISFAAGGFRQYLEASIDWKRVMPIVDYVNLMTYDLVNGATPHTGHHTALYSTEQQSESTDACVQYLCSIGVPKHKMVIGAAFYGRSWSDVENLNNGLYQKGDFKSFLPYNMIEKVINKENGFTFYYDSVAKATYAYNANEKIFATFDDENSVFEKTKYALRNHLGGIMFWELSTDKKKNGYLDVIYKTINSVSEL